jgi:hypothetical protein
MRETDKKIEDKKQSEKINTASETLLSTFLID